MSLRKLFAMTPVLLAAISTGVHATDIRATLSTLEAYVGNPIILRVEVGNAENHARPHVGSMDGVDIFASGTPSRSSQTTIINGRRSERSSITYAWKLTPRREGVFTIAPIGVEVDGNPQSTKPLRFSATKSEAGDLVLTEINGQQDEIFVGQPMKLKLRIWLKPFVDRDLDITLSEADMWQMISLEKSNWGMFEERINALASNNQRPSGEEVLRADASGVERRYYLYEIEADTYPKRPGHIDADSVQIVVDYPTRLGKARDPFESFFDNRFPSMLQDRMPAAFRSRLEVTDARPIVTGAKVDAIEVRAIPTAGRPADYRGAVGHYQIMSHAAPVSVKAGDPITLHLGIQGDGPMDLVQAPPLSQLPALSSDFKVADEPLAGIAENDAKVFTTSIRPRRAGITQIPAVPFSFFDPAAKRFVTVHSKPITIAVAAADQLALDTIVGRAANPQSSSKNMAEPEIGLNLNNYAGQQVLESTVSQSPWSSTLAWLLPPMLFLAAFLTRYRKYMIRLLGISRGEDFKRALAHLGSASSAGDISHALVSFVADRLGTAKLPKSPSNVIERVEPALGSDTKQKFRSILQECEQLSYAGLDGTNIAGLRNEAAICLQRLAAELPDSDDTTGGWPGVTLVTGRAAKAAALIAWIALTTGEYPPVCAAELTPAQSSQLLVEATAKYADAQRTTASDSAESKGAFSEAAQKYQTLVEDGVRSDQLYFNLGNAYLQSGSSGLAIANYERALALNSASPARQNLTQARALLPHATDRVNRPQGIFETVHVWNQALPRSAVWGLGLFGWAVFWLGAAARTFNRIPRIGVTMIPAGVLASVCIASLCLALLGPPAQDRVVVIAPEIHLRAGNGQAFAETDAVVHQGASYDLIEQRGEWMKVKVEKQSGWIQQSDALRVAT